MRGSSFLSSNSKLRGLTLSISLFQQKLFRLFSRKHSPQTALLARYAVCFFLGGLVGLVPYLVFAIEVCKGLFPLLFHLWATATCVLLDPVINCFALIIRRGSWREWRGVLNPSSQPKFGPSPSSQHKLGPNPSYQILNVTPSDCL